MELPSKQNKSCSSSLCCFIHYHVTFPSSGLNIFHGTLFLNTIISYEFLGFHSGVTEDSVLDMKLHQLVTGSRHSEAMQYPHLF
jgi:hypothetical protein